MTFLQFRCLQSYYAPSRRPAGRDHCTGHPYLEANPRSMPRICSAFVTFCFLQVQRMQRNAAHYLRRVWTLLCVTSSAFPGRFLLRASAHCRACRGTRGSRSTSRTPTPTGCPRHTHGEGIDTAVCFICCMVDASCATSLLWHCSVL